MTKILLKSYRNEYETSDISVEELCEKYNLDINELEGHEEWEKWDMSPSHDISMDDTEEDSQNGLNEEGITTVETIDDIPDEPVEAEVLEPNYIVPPVFSVSQPPVEQHSNLPSIDVNDEEHEQVLKDIDRFKVNMVKHCNDLIEKGSQHLEIKELKDTVAIMDSIEKSYKDSKPQGPTINVLIQNLQQRIKATPDDC